MNEEFLVSSQDEKYLIDYLLYQVKLQKWSSVIQVAADLIALERMQDYKKKSLSADAGMIDK